MLDIALAVLLCILVYAITVIFTALLCASWDMPYARWMLCVCIPLFALAVWIWSRITKKKIDEYKDYR